MALSMEMVKIALTFKPDTCTLVPETAEEITTTGGLDAILFSEKIEEISSNLKAAGIEVSLFIDPDIEQIKAAHRIKITVIELNTGAYAENWNTSYAILELKKLEKAAAYAKKLEFKILAGHGLTYQNIHPIVNITEIEELNIGHSIVANATFMGIGEAVRRMKALIKR
jgi:pyridoxine 5-phosphate synthase